MLARISRYALPAALALGLISVAGAPVAASAAARPEAVTTHYTVTWAGVVNSVNVKQHRFVYTWDGGKYTVTYTSKTKWSKGTAKSLKKGLHVTVTGNLKGSTIAATKIVV